MWQDGDRTYLPSEQISDSIMILFNSFLYVRSGVC